MDIHFTPLRDRVVIKPDEAEERVGSIIIPDNAKDKPTRGTVLAVGPGEWKDGHLRPMTVKEGDRVVYGRYAAGELKIDGELLALLREEQVFGILHE